MSTVPALMNRTPANHHQKLPHDIWYYIAQYMNTRDLCRLVEFDEEFFSFLWRTPTFMQKIADQYPDIAPDQASIVTKWNISVSSLMRSTQGLLTEQLSLGSLLDCIKQGVDNTAALWNIFENPNPPHNDMPPHEIGQIIDRVCKTALPIIRTRNFDTSSGELCFSCLETFRPYDNTNGSRVNTLTFKGAELIKALIQAGVQVVYANRNGVTMLHEAAGFINPPYRDVDPIVKTLVENGSDVNKTRPHTWHHFHADGDTPLHEACKWIVCNTTDANIRFLLDNGADPWIRNRKGLSALDILKSQKVRFPDTIECLVQYAHDTMIARSVDDARQVWQEYENTTGDYYLSGNIEDLGTYTI